MKPLISFALPILCTLATACGGGGGGSGAVDSPPVSTDPGIYRPNSPTGLGQAGPMDGNWNVTAISLIDDPRTRNPDLDESFFLVNDEIEFRGGRIDWDEEAPPEPVITDPNGTPFPTLLEFAVNDPVAEGTLFGFGFQLGPNWFFGPGAKRLAVVFGTTGPSTAVGIMVDAEQFAGGALLPVDRFQVVQIQLERTTSLPSQLEVDELAAAGSIESDSLDRRSLLRSQLREAWPDR